MNAALAAPMRPKSKMPATPEIVLSACLVALALFTAFVASDDKVAGDREPTTWWHWFIIVGPAVPVAFRRVAPLTATPISVIAQIVVWGMGLASAFFAPLVMIYTVCAEPGERGRRLGIASGAALCVMTVIGVIAAPDVTIDLLVFTSLAVTLAYLLGTNAAQNRTAEVEMAEQLAITRIERDVARERAAADERQRIARELHDIVGHSLSVIAVRAEAADRVAPNDPAAAVDAVSAIALTARSSLADVRRVLAGLRDADAEVELAPLPSLAAVPNLLMSVAGAGASVALDGELPRDDQVGATVGAGAYRIVQEALTNVLKHGGPDVEATVRVGLDDCLLVVTVEDTGRGPSAVPTDDGLGLAGMRERAEVLGGRLESGPRPGGGYRLVAELPVDSAHRTASDVAADWASEPRA